MRTIILILFFVLCGDQLFPKKIISIESDQLKKKLKEAHQIIHEQREKLIAYELQIELEKIKDLKETKLLKLEIEHLKERGYKLGFFLFVLICFALYSVKRQQNM